jgi:mRNA interferase YafQ
MDMAKLADVVRILADGEMLPREYCDHTLHGKYEGYRECHIEPDWLLIYKITESALVLSLVRTGSHSRLFRR